MLHYQYIVYRDIVTRNTEVTIAPQNLPPRALPPGSPAYYILLSLVNGEKHGYAIMKDVEDLSDGEMTLSTSTLYEALSRLLEQGLIERVEAGEPQNGRRVRKAYRLSRLGRQTLDAETARLEGLVRQAQRRLLQGEP